MIIDSGITSKDANQHTIWLELRDVIGPDIALVLPFTGTQAQAYERLGLLESLLRDVEVTIQETEQEA